MIIDDEIPSDTFLQMSINYYSPIYSILETARDKHISFLDILLTRKKFLDTFG